MEFLSHFLVMVLKELKTSFLICVRNEAQKSLLKFCLHLTFEVAQCLQEHSASVRIYQNVPETSSEENRMCCLMGKFEMLCIV